VAVGDGGDGVEEPSPDPGVGVNPQHVERPEHCGEYHLDVGPRRHALVPEPERGGVLPHEPGPPAAGSLPFPLRAAPDGPGGTGAGEEGAGEREERRPGGAAGRPREVDAAEVGTAVREEERRWGGEVEAEVGGHGGGKQARACGRVELAGVVRWRQPKWGGEV